MIPGDGIGPEISEAVKIIFAAAKVKHRPLVIIVYFQLGKVPITWVEVDVKPVMLPSGQTTIPQKAIDQIKALKIGLKGKAHT